MSHPTDIAEVGAALTLLAQAEREFPSQRSADALSEAFDTLNDLLEYDPPGPEAERYISNVKYAHCKRIVERFAEVDPTDFEVWFHYAVLLLVKMKDEFDALREQHPDLGRVYEQCVGRHGAALEAAAAKVPPRGDGDR